MSNASTCLVLILAIFQVVRVRFSSNLSAPCVTFICAGTGAGGPHGERMEQWRLPSRCGTAGHRWRQQFTSLELGCWRVVLLKCSPLADMVLLRSAALILPDTSAVMAACRCRANMHHVDRRSALAAAECKRTGEQLDASHTCVKLTSQSLGLYYV